VSAYTALTVAGVDGVPWPGGITWHPLRMALGLRAFGAAAYTGGPGTVVVEPHTESADGRGHEELYVVLSGRATFTLGAEELDAGEGTLVRVAPETHRAAVATEPGTCVLAFGGPPTFEVAGSEWLALDRPRMREDPDGARAILEEGLGELPDSAAIPYGVALLEASLGDSKAAHAALETALAREPRLRDEAAAEPSLAPLL